MLYYHTINGWCVVCDRIACGEINIMLTLAHIADVYWSEPSLLFPLIGIYNLPQTASRAFGVSAGIRFVIVFVIFLVNLAYQHSTVVIWYSVAAILFYFVLLYIELHQLTHLKSTITQKKHGVVIWNSVHAVSPSTFLYDTRTKTPLTELFLFVVKGAIAASLVTEHIDHRHEVPAVICYPTGYPNNRLLDKGVCPSGLPLNYAENETMAHACDVLYADSFRPKVCFLHKGQELPYFPVSKVVVHLIWAATAVVALYISLIPSKYKLSSASTTVLSSYTGVGLVLRFGVLVTVAVIVPSLFI